MKATCCVGGCGWSITDEAIVELEAFAEVHRATNHDWVKRGKCHRVELEPAELAAVDAKLENWEAVRTAAERSRPWSAGLAR